MNTLNAEFRAYWNEWKSERTTEESCAVELQRAMLENTLQNDPLFSTGLLTNEGLQCYRSVVPLTHTDQSLLKGKNHATSSVIHDAAEASGISADAGAAQQLADQNHANAV